MYYKHIIHILLFLLLHICNIYSQTTYYKYQILGTFGYSNPIQINTKSHHFKGAGLTGNADVHLYFNQFSGLALSVGRAYHSSTSRFNEFLQDKYLVNNLATSRPGWTNISFLGGPVFKFRKQKFEIDGFAQVGIYVIKVPFLQFRVLMNNEMYDIASLYGGVEQVRLAWQSGFNIHYRLNQYTSVLFKSSLQSNLGLSKYYQLFRYRDVSDINNNAKIDISEYINAPLIEEESLINFLHVNVSLGVSYAFGLKNSSAEISSFSEVNNIYPVMEVFKEQTDSLTHPIRKEIKDTIIQISQKQTSENTKIIDNLKPTEYVIQNNNNRPEKTISNQPESNDFSTTEIDKVSNSSPVFKETTAIVRIKLLTENSQNDEKEAVNNDQNLLKKSTEYKIQIIALSANQKDIISPDLNIPIEVEYNAEIKLFKYMTGRFSSENEALKKLMEIRALGFSDAFIAIYNDNKRVSTAHHK